VTFQPAFTNLNASNFPITPAPTTAAFIPIQ
jgi:hypothetical protein